MLRDAITEGAGSFVAAHRNTGVGTALDLTERQGNTFQSLHDAGRIRGTLWLHRSLPCTSARMAPMGSSMGVFETREVNVLACFVHDCCPTAGRSDTSAMCGMEGPSRPFTRSETSDEALDPQSLHGRGAFRRLLGNCCPTRNWP